MNLQISVKNLLVLLIFYSFLALVLAYLSQFGFDLQPCILCLHQRKTFFAIIAIASLVLIFFKSEKSQKITFFFCLFLLLINAAIATYHVGVEQKIFKGPTTCSSESLNDFQNL